MPTKSQDHESIIRHLRKAPMTSAQLAKLTRRSGRAIGAVMRVLQKRGIADQDSQGEPWRLLKDPAQPAAKKGAKKPAKKPAAKKATRPAARVAAPPQQPQEAVPVPGLVEGVVAVVESKEEGYRAAMTAIRDISVWAQENASTPSAVAAVLQMIRLQTEAFVGKKFPTLELPFSIERIQGENGERDTIRVTPTKNGFAEAPKALDANAPKAWANWPAEGDGAGEAEKTEGADTPPPVNGVAEVPPAS